MLLLKQCTYHGGSRMPTRKSVIIGRIKLTGFILCCLIAVREWLAADRPNPLKHHGKLFIHNFSVKSQAGQEFFRQFLFVFLYRDTYEYVLQG